MRGLIVAGFVAAVMTAAPAASTLSETPQVGGAIAFAANEPNCLNLFVPACEVVAGPDPSVPRFVLKGAFKVAPDFTLRPDLVSRVEFTRTPPFTLTYHIRPEAIWSDGEQISAKDFVFTHWAMRKYRSADAPAHSTQVRSVHALDPKTVRVVLTGRFAGWRSGLFDVILPRHALLGEDLTSIWKDRIDNPKTGEPIGSGPFLVERWERGKQLILVRNPLYRTPHPAYLKRLLFRFVQFPGGDPADVLRRGDVDIYWSPVSRQEDFTRVPGYRTHFWHGRNFEHFEIRIGPGGHRALKIKLVRRALAYGIDRVGVVRSLYGKIDAKLQPLDSMAFLTQSRFYRPNWNSYRYRPGEARRLLEQAGCRRGADGIYACGGEELSFRLVTTAGSARRELTLRLVQQQLRQVGIEVKLTYAPSGALFDQILTSGDFDLALFAYFGPPDSSGLADAYDCGRPSNLTGYCQRLVTRDLDQAGRILDQDQWARVLNRADAQMARDVPALPLFQPLLAAYVRSNIRNYVDRFPLDRWKAENWWLER